MSSAAKATSPAETASNYFELLTTNKDYDFTFALENPRFSDYTLEVIPVSQAEDPPQATPSQDTGPELDILYANGPGLWSQAPTLGSDVINLLADELETNLSTEEKILIPVSSLILGVRSLYFRCVFDSGQYSVSRRVPLKIHSREVEPLKILLHFMYLYSDSPLKEMDIPELLRFFLLADKLQVPAAVKSTINELKSRPIDPEVCTRFLDLPEHLEPITYPLLDQCADYLEDHFAHFDLVLHDQVLRGEFCSLSRRAFSFLLRSDKVSVQSENTVFVLLQYWAKSHGLPPEAFHEEPYRELLEHLRYAYMSMEFLNGEVSPSRMMATAYAHKLVNEGCVFRSAPESFREKLLDEAMHIRFVERPKPPVELLEKVDPQLSPRRSGGISSLVGRWGSYMLGMEPKTSHKFT